MEKKLAKMPYAQAKVIIMDNGAIVLRSYYTDVALIQSDGWLSINGLYSATTRKHIGAFMREYANSNYQLAKCCMKIKWFIIFIPERLPQFEGNFLSLDVLRLKVIVVHH